MARILVVDDDNDMLKMLEALLVSHQHKVFLSENAQAAVKLLNTENIDAVISDANMPQYDGFDLVRTIRNEQRFDRIAVAMLTGRSQRSDVEMAVQAGVDDYILKPVDPAVFLAKVAALLAKKQTSQSMTLHLEKSPLNTIGSISVPMRILKLSDLGITIQSLLPLDSTIPFRLLSDLLKENEIELPPLQAMRSHRLPHDEGYEITIKFVDLSESSRKKIQALVLKQQEQHPISIEVRP